jgi:hypothetical protein
MEPVESRESSLLGEHPPLEKEFKAGTAKDNSFDITGA